MEKLENKRRVQKRVTYNLTQVAVDDNIAAPDETIPKQERETEGGGGGGGGEGVTVLSGDNATFHY